jgi:Arc/MetJ-type ribon-helix-helix transcriptional regulator
MTKERITISVDPELVQAAAAAVAEGRAESVSAWVNAALEDKVAKERRLTELAAAVAAFEAEHGAIDDEEMARQVQADRDAAAAVRARSRRRGVV